MSTVWKTLGILCVLGTLLGCGHLAATSGSLGAGPYANMMALTDATSARASSFDKTGGNADFIPLWSGSSATILDAEGAGVINHVYFTIMGVDPNTPDYLNHLVIRAWWDGEAEPSVETPFGPFFGQGHEKVTFFRSQMITVNEGAALSDSQNTFTVGFNCYFPMPFSEGARIELKNEGPTPIPAIWYHIDYEKRPAVSPGVGRFHAQYRQEKPTTPAPGPGPFNVISGEGFNNSGDENYVILDAQGHGNYAGCFLYVNNVASSWYGEGDDMIFIDGESWPPSIHGTGTEEIFGGGACPNIPYAGPYTGYHYIENQDYSGEVSMYRFCVADPVRFKQSIRVTLEHGHNNNYGNDYASVAFWYQSEPHKPFGPLSTVSERWGMKKQAARAAARAISAYAIVIPPTDPRASVSIGWYEFKDPTTYTGTAYWAPTEDPWCTVTYTPKDLAPGKYKISFWVPRDWNGDRASDALIRWREADGSVTESTLDLTKDFEQWQEVGAINIGSDSIIRVRSKGSGAIVADALRLDRVE